MAYFNIIKYQRLTLAYFVSAPNLNISFSPTELFCRRKYFSHQNHFFVKNMFVNKIILLTKFFWDEKEDNSLVWTKTKVVGKSSNILGQK